MGLNTRYRLIGVAISSILFTGPAAFSLTKTEMGKDTTYERAEHEYVLTPRREVAVYCNANDELVKGSCEGSTGRIVPAKVNSMLMDEPRADVERGIYVDSKEVKDGRRTGWACWTKVVHADEELRISSFASCKKSELGNKALKIKTPRNRGA